jgi:signal transduction histidine kinase
MPQMQALRRSLAVKITAVTVGIMIAGFGALLFLNIRRDTEFRVSKYHETADLLAASITTSIQNGMLEGRPDIIRRLVQELKTELKNVRRLNVYRRNGDEAFGDLDTLREVERIAGLDSDVVSQILKMPRQPGARVSHPLFARAVETVEPQETYTSVNGTRVLTLFQPLRNLPECQECHGKDHRVRGVIEVTLGLEELDAELREAQTRQIAVALITIFGVSIAGIIAMGRVVLRPIARVSAAAQRIGKGEFDGQVPIESEDEIGQLGKVMNDTAARLKKVYGELESEISERRLAEEEIRRQATALELSNRVKDEFLSVVSHELRTPLSAVMGYAALMKEGALGEIRSEQQAALRVIEKQTGDLLGMINSILDASKIGTGAVEVERQEVDLNGLLEEIRETYGIPLGKDLAIVWASNGPLPPIRTDRAKLKTILQNLIGNAIKFTDRGEVVISARHLRQAGAMEFQVVDTGIGVPKEMQRAIFDRFRQADSSDTRRYGGVGLGLYIVDTFTRRLGGTVEVESEPGKGSTFTVRLPA